MLDTFLIPELQGKTSCNQTDLVPTRRSNGPLSKCCNRTRGGSSVAVISRNGNITWPARSPDLSACDFFFWGHLKSKVYAKIPHTLEHLKEAKGEVIAYISNMMLSNVIDNLAAFVYFFIVCHLLLLIISNKRDRNS